MTHGRLYTVSGKKRVYPFLWIIVTNLNMLFYNYGTHFPNDTFYRKRKISFRNVIITNWRRRKYRFRAKVASNWAFAIGKAGQLLKNICIKIWQIGNTKINYFLPNISNISSIYRHAKRGRHVHYGNVVQQPQQHVSASCVSVTVRGVDPYGTGGTRPPQYLDRGGHDHECPPPNISRVISATFYPCNIFLISWKSF